MDSQHILENAYKKNWRPRTLEDLYKIQLEPSNRIIRPVLDTYIRPKVEFNTRNAWAIYCRIYALNRAKGPWYHPNYKRRIDILRYWLHIKLINMGVII